MNREVGFLYLCLDVLKRVFEVPVPAILVKIIG